MCQDEALDDRSLHPYPTWSVRVCECVHAYAHVPVCVQEHTPWQVYQGQRTTSGVDLIFHLAWDRVSLFFICEYRTSWLEIRGLSYLSLPLATRAQELQPCVSKPGFVWVPDPSACAANTAPLSLLTTSSSIRVNSSKEFNLFTNTVGCGSARF